MIKFLLMSPPNFSMYAISKWCHPCLNHFCKFSLSWFGDIDKLHPPIVKVHCKLTSSLFVNIPSGPIFLHWAYFV